MKFSVATLAAVISTAHASITADSVVGRDLMSKATSSRALEQQYDWATQYAWLTGYSVKFQGCLNIKQWNDEVDEQNDVRIQTKRLVRFRLCPSDSCSSTKAAGCNSAFGEYVVDMDSFVNSYLTGLQQAKEYDCEYHYLFNCDCDKENNQDNENFNEDYCKYDCYVNAGLDSCVDQNPYEENGQQQNNDFQIENYYQCAELKVQNQRKLNNNQNQQVRYYVGPYCGSQGGSIKMGLFTDDTCTQPASDVTFEDLMGFDLPYSTDEASLIAPQCLGCVEKQDAQQAYEAAQADDANAAAVDDDAVDADNVNEMCENLYTMAGKCESSYPSGMVASPNNNACTYMEGIQIVRQDGIIDTGSTRPSAVATAFIVIFAMAFAAMAFYVWYLRTRLGVKKNTLL